MENYAIWSVAAEIEESELEGFDRGQMDEIIDAAIEEEESLIECLRGIEEKPRAAFSRREVIEFLRANREHFSAGNDLVMVAV